MIFASPDDDMGFPLRELTNARVAVYPEQAPRAPGVRELTTDGADSSDGTDGFDEFFFIFVTFVTFLTNSHT